MQSKVYSRPQRVQGKEDLGLAAVSGQQAPVLPEQWRCSALAIRAPSTAADRQEIFTQKVLPTLPQNGIILMEGDFNCFFSDLDVTHNAAGRYRTGFSSSRRHMVSRVFEGCSTQPNVL